MTHDKSSHNPQPAYKRLWPLALLTALVGILFFGDKGLMRLLQLERQKAQLQAELRKGEEVNGTLRGEIESLRNDPKTIEGIARRELGMVKEDEVVYQFRTSTNRTSSAERRPQTSTGR